MNIAIIGTGGVGGYFGSKLVRSKKDGDNVYFIARGAHLEKIKENGLVVKSKNDGDSVCHPTLATDNIKDLPMLDICIICVKSYDLSSVLEQLKEKIKETTEIIPLLNGIDIYERVRKVITKGYVYPACVYIGTHISEPGVISQNGGQCRIIFGKDYEKTDGNAVNIREHFERANIDFLWTESYLKEIWGKFLCISSYALVTAAYNKTMGQVYEDKELSSKLLGIMNVIYKISEKKHINLPADSIDTAYKKAIEFPYDTKTSFQRDYEKENKKDERESLCKIVIEQAKKYGIDASVVESVYSML